MLQRWKNIVFKSHCGLNQETRVEGIDAVMLLVAAANVRLHFLYLEFIWNHLEKRGCNDSLDALHNFIFFKET